MIDFDSIDEWEPELSLLLGNYLPKEFKKNITKLRPKYTMDARDFFFQYVDRKKIIYTILEWLKSETIIGYHGTRLIKEEILSVKRQGLIPLDAMTRKVRLTRVLKSHPELGEELLNLETIIMDFKNGHKYEGREGQVHLTLSRAGLLNGFNHYLQYGSEIDQRILAYLLDIDWKKLLSEDGDPFVIKVALPGEIAINGAHPYFPVFDLLERGETPNIVNEFLQSWCFKQAYPNFQASSLEEDCGMMFFRPIPPDWIVEMESLSNNNFDK